MQCEIKVSIICNTYNQKKYISRCITGFLSQKTDFEYEILIHDDASTDGTDAIIKEFYEKYPTIIKPIFQKENQYKKKVYITPVFQLPRAKGKYIAFCEGDDYWEDDRKLQKQVDILERNSECALVYTNCRVFNQELKAFKKNTFTRKINSFDELLINGNFIGTLTTCLRKSVLEQYYQEICPQSKGWRAGDYPLWLYIFYNHKTVFITDSTSVYREQCESASHYSNPQKQCEFDYNIFTIRKYYSTYSGIKIDDWDENYELMKRYFKSCLIKYNKDNAKVFRNLKKKTVIKKRKSMWGIFEIASYSKIMMKLIASMYLK